ncbi:MAG TPA: hypothetical protein VHP99_09410 [Pyrinomonadaceae bacterium]|jgi:hypothetical protein|nr:hypothetical protein [Pyrinomonadaceae bacterium]
MMNKLRFTALVIFAITVFCAPAFSQTSEKTEDPLTQKYCNDRFGFCVYHPANVGWRDQQGVWHSGNAGAPSENNDGSKFDNGNGFEMTVSGINNTSNDTLTSEMNSAKKGFDKITYRAKGKNWFILKGQKADTIIFLKTYIGRGSVNHLQIVVPVALKEGYNQLMSDVAGSFSPGKLSAAH